MIPATQSRISVAERDPLLHQCEALSQSTRFQERIAQPPTRRCANRAVAGPIREAHRLLAEGAIRGEVAGEAANRAVGSCEHGEGFEVARARGDHLALLEDPRGLFG
jgi:hypothetical protein